MRPLFFTTTNLHVHMLLYTLQRHKNIFKPVTLLSIWRISRFSKFFQTYIGLFKKIFLPFIPCLREPVIKFTRIQLMRQRKKDRRRNFLQLIFMKVLCVMFVFEKWILPEKEVENCSKNMQICSCIQYNIIIFNILDSHLGFCFFFVILFDEETKCERSKV